MPTRKPHTRGHPLSYWIAQFEEGAAGAGVALDAMGESSIEPLARLAGFHPDRAVRQRAVGVLLWPWTPYKEAGAARLGLLRDRAAAIDSRLFLAEVCRSPRCGRDVARVAADALRPVGDDPFRQGDGDVWRAIALLKRLGPDGALAVPELTAALESRDPEVRVRAREALAAIGPPARLANGALQARLDDPYYDVVAAAQDALSKMTEATAGPP